MPSPLSVISTRSTSSWTVAVKVIGSPAGQPEAQAPAVNYQLVVARGDRDRWFVAAMMLAARF